MKEWVRALVDRAAREIVKLAERSGEEWVEKVFDEADRVADRLRLGDEGTAALRAFLAAAPRTEIAAMGVTGAKALLVRVLEDDPEGIRTMNKLERRVAVRALQNRAIESLEAAREARRAVVEWLQAAGAALLKSAIPLLLALL